MFDLSHSGLSQYQVYNTSVFIHLTCFDSKNHPQRRTVTIRKHCHIRCFWWYAIKLCIMLTIKFFLLFSVHLHFKKCRECLSQTSKLIVIITKKNFIVSIIHSLNAYCQNHLTWQCFLIVTVHLWGWFFESKHVRWINTEVL
jgi:hypothetical protein